VLVGVAIALLPIGVHFAGDPLLRLRDLDPELSPPAATAECGSPLGSLKTTAKGTSLHELARVHACREAARRRLLIAAAVAGAIIMFGLVARAAAGRGGLVHLLRSGAEPGTKPPVPVASG
jgi:hypothetical protein